MDRRRTQLQMVDCRLQIHLPISASISNQSAICNLRSAIPEGPRCRHDPTLDVNLTRALEESKRLADSIKPGSDRWDVIVVGSGAAGGMAAFQLAMAGTKVLLLEAGRMIDVRTEYKTMEWPYASNRRNRLPPGERPIDVAEYSFLDRPYGSNPVFEKHKKVMSYAANRFTRNWVVDERQNPTTGTPYSWVRANVLGGKTNFWGRGALRYGPLQFNAASRDGFDVDWPISYEDVKPYYDKVDVLLGCSGHERRADAGAGRRVPAPVEAQLRRSVVQALDRKDGAPLHSGPRRGHDRGRPEQQVSGAVRWARPVRARLRHPGGVPFADGAHLSGARQRQPYRAAVLEGLRSARRRGVEPRHRRARHRREHARGDGLQGAGGRARGRRAGHHAHPAQLTIARASERPREFVGRARLLPERAHHGHPRQRLHPNPDGHRNDARRWTSRGAVHPAVSQHHRQTSGLHSRLSLPGRRRLRRVPGHGARHPGVRQGVQVERAQALSRAHQLRRLWRGAAAQGEPRHARSRR